VERASSLPPERPASCEASVPPTERVARYADGLMQVGPPAPKRYSTLTRRAALARGMKPLKRTPLRRKPRTTPYGGASLEFPNVGDFQAFIRRRDRQMCQNCPRWGAPPDVAHLLWKVGMGGQKKVSINHPWNACLLCRECHRQQEVSRELTARLVRRIVARKGYSLPEQAQRDLARIDAQYDIFEPHERDAFTPELSAVDGRA
jgi:hypothetical protein